MEDCFRSIGAVKIFEGEITQKEYDSYNKQDPNKGEEGDMGYPGEANSTLSAARKWGISMFSTPPIMRLEN